MTPVVVVDPSLGRTGAHNRGFVEMLLARRGGRVGACVNRAIAGPLRARLEADAALLAPVFTVDFYALAGRDGHVAEHWDWIWTLAREYVEAFDAVLARWPGQAVRVLHHTLSWEHASALGVAIGLVGERGSRLQHVAMLMYSPGVDGFGRVVEPQRRLNFQLAFSALDRTPGVALYAGCSEYAVAYAALLRRATPLPVHPCLVGDRGARPPAREAAAREQVLLYAGEIKQDKGFLALPDVASAMLDEAGPPRTLVVQCVEARNDTARDVIARLQAIAARDPRLEVHHGFWSEAELEAALAATTVMRLDYDPRAYAHKSSGLLWLAAWHGVAVSVPPGTWLEREARRLGVPVVPAGAPCRAAHARVDRRLADPAYAATLFTPFLEWLDALPAPSSAAAAVVTMPPPASPTDADLAAEAAVRRRARALPGPAVGTGADVVLFWKQNDSTLYGRRSDMVARYLASRPDVRRVLVVDAPIGTDELARLAGCPHPVRHERLLAARILGKLAGEHDDPATFHTTWVHPRGEWAADEVDRPGPGFTAAYLDFLREEFARFGIEPARAVFWIYPKNFLAPAVIGHFAPARVVVDVVDDHRAWPGVDDATRARLTGNYRELLASADMAFANCEPVRDAMAVLGVTPRLVPNGCDRALRDRAARGGQAAGADGPAPFAGRTLGFVGNLETKIDIALLSRVAESFPDCRLLLVGSTHANPDVLALRRHPNVVMPGVVPYDRLGAWLAAFDVALVPHLATELTRTMNPLKAYVYLAAGLPVVSTAVPNIAVADGLIDVASSHEAFIAAIASRLASPPPHPERFAAFVDANDWASRFGAHIDALGPGRLAAGER